MYDILYSHITLLKYECDACHFTNPWSFLVYHHFPQIVTPHFQTHPNEQCAKPCVFFWYWLIGIAQLESDIPKISQMYWVVQSPN